AVLDLKERFSGGLARILPEPESSLAGGLIVGTKQSLGAKLLPEFRAAGVIHLVVLSGYNITIVAEAANRALAFLPAIFSSAIGAIGILLFALMTGAGATVVRASIMALLVIFARRVGRPYAIGRALLLAGSLMILQNPFILVFDPSFQLSFLATFALVYVAPILEPHMTRFPERFGLREIATTTIATQIFVLPFILYTMGDMSIVAVPVNMLILGVVPLTMLLGFVGGLIGMVSTSVGMIVGLPAYALLAYMLGIVDTASRLPLSVVHVPAFPFTVVASIYVVYAYIIYTVHKKRKEKEMIDRSYDRV
ncbi:MAG: ComEC/Rec2 family competence protein, partial [Candidatus Yonathbacteria bacterium]|nr:ComEC/Rec2 family competence protein [Candidatus Yonathbacteria bacterium]